MLSLLNRRSSMYKYLLAVIITLSINPLVAQTIVSAAQTASVQSSGAEPRVTVRFREVALRAAVKEIIEQSNASVSYSVQSLPSGARVSYEGVNVPLVDALKAV